MINSKNLSQYRTLSGSTGPAKNIVRIKLFYVLNHVIFIKVHRN